MSTAARSATMIVGTCVFAEGIIPYRRGAQGRVPLTARSATLRRNARVALATRRLPPSPDVVGLSEERSEDAHDAQEDDDPDDDDGDQKEDQKPKATAVTLTHYDHLWRWWGCLTHSKSLSAPVNRSSPAGLSWPAGVPLNLGRPSSGSERGFGRDLCVLSELAVRGCN
jgi:hypothetical protein